MFADGARADADGLGSFMAAHAEEKEPWELALAGLSCYALACHVGVAENGLIHRIAHSDAAVDGCRLPEEGDRASAWSNKGR